MVVAGDIEASGGLTIPDWSLSWIHGLHIQYWHDGDLETVRRHLPSAERVLRWYTSYLDERGTIADVPEWNLVDWASIFLSGRSSILTALWARGLNDFAELSDAVGNAGSHRGPATSTNRLPRVTRISGIRIGASTSTTFSRGNASRRPPRSRKPVPSSRAWRRESAGVRSWMR